MAKKAKKPTPGMQQADHLTPLKYLDLLDDDDFIQGKWRDQAACIYACQNYPEDYDPMDWFPHSYHAVPPKVKDICGGCASRLECLVYALSTRQSEGIWAGRSESQIRAIRRRLAKALEEYLA